MIDIATTEYLGGILGGNEGNVSILKWGFLLYFLGMVVWSNGIKGFMWIFSGSYSGVSGPNFSKTSSRKLSSASLTVSP